MIDINNKTKSRIDKNLINKTVLAFLKYFKIKEKEISIAFIGDVKMREFNKIYRGYDKTTDVLSFGETGDPECLGEIIINYAQIKRQSAKYSSSVKKELLYILAHGLLHLIGYEDETEKGKNEMYRLADQFFKDVKI